MTKRIPTMRGHVLTLHLESEGLKQMKEKKNLKGNLVMFNNNLHSKLDWGESGIKILREETLLRDLF